MEEILARKFQVLKHAWNERQRRLWAASEAMCLGRSGVTTVAQAIGMSRTTITRGIQERKNEKTKDTKFCITDGPFRRN